MFSLYKATSSGRRGQLHTAHGVIETPFFMPVGTRGAMKGISHDQLTELGAQILLSNTYHLHLRPGEDVIAQAGGMHTFIGWHKPMLTDSGGFQVYSMRDNNAVTDDGVHFRSHIDGAPLFLGPEEAIRIQHKIGANMIMCFDECPPSTASRYLIEKAVDRTLRWAKLCKQVHEKLKHEGSDHHKSIALFAIVQGGLHADLRKKCAEELIAMDFDGYAIGGLAVGETESEMYDVVDMVCPLLPEDKARYLMGVGVPHQMRACVAKGIDMFDCVRPARIARRSELMLSDESTIRIGNAEFREDVSAIDPHSPSRLSREHSRAYLHHLFRVNEQYARTIAVMQNVGVTLAAMQKLREEMESKTLLS